MRIVLVSCLLTVIGCADRRDPTSATRAAIGEGGPHLAALDVALASGARVRLGAQLIQSDPIFLIYGAIDGESTDHKPPFEVHVTVSGPTAAPTLAIGIAAVTSILSGSATAPYADNLLAQSGGTLVLSGDSAKTANINASDAEGLAKLGSATTLLAGGTTATTAMANLAGAFGLPDPCAGSQCDRMHVVYDIAPTANGDRVAIVVGGVAGASVTACYQGANAPPPETLVTDANGLAITSAPAGVSIAGVSVNAQIDGELVTCSKGAVCGLVVGGGKF